MSKEKETVEQKTPIIKVDVSQNKMEAYINVEIPENCREVTKEDITKALEESGVKYQIDNAEIDRRVETQSFINEFQCSKGLEPKDGIDGSLQYLFEKEPVLKPKVNKDGSTDYHEMGLVQNVEKGQVLCTRVLPKPGEDGTNVFGDVVPFKPGKEFKFESGKNTEISEDELQLVSSVNGHVEYKNRKVEVNDTFTVRGDVDTSTGDIVFCGNVVVMGDVCEGFKIHAEKDVTINGMVEGATIWAKGDVKITQGMNGMNSGFIYCGGNVTSKYFQNSEIQCQGDVTADYYLNGSVTAGGTVFAEGKRGVLLGGTYEGGQSIIAKTIGADTYLTTKVGIVSNPEEFWNPEAQKSDEEILAELETMSQEEREAWLAEHVYVAPSAPENAKIVAKGRVYPGVILTIGQWSVKLEDEYSNTSFYYNNTDGQIVNAPA